MLDQYWLRSTVIVCLVIASSCLCAEEPGKPIALSPTLLMRHPQAKILLQEVSLSGGEMSLLKFGEFLKTKFGLIVDFDKRALEEEAVDLNKLFPMPVLKNVTLLNALWHYLSALNCAFIEEPHRLVISTKTTVIAVRPRVLFPVQDLVSAEPKFELEDLYDPIFDRDDSFRQRLYGKLQKRVTWQLNNVSFNDFVALLRKELDENVTSDAEKLVEESIKPDAHDISCDYANVPLKDALSWVLKAKGLAYVIHHESLLITSRIDSLSGDLRVYPASGLVFRDVSPNRSEFIAVTPQWNDPGLGWLGTYDGGFGGMFGPNSPDSPPPIAEVGGRYFRMRIPLTAPPANAPSDVTGIRPMPVDAPLSATDPTTVVQDNAYSLLDDILDHTGGSPDAQWMYFIDGGSGGMLALYYPSLSIVVSQSDETHTEIAAYLQQMRDLQTKRGANPAMVALTAKDAAARPEKAAFALIKLLENNTAGPPDSPWTQRDGVGGTVTYDKARLAITVRQTPSALDEIAGLLVQFRRHRYELFHGTRPWESGRIVERKPMAPAEKPK